MGDNPLTDISPLKKCSMLTHVCFNNCRLKDIEALRNKPMLDTVCLVNCGLRSIEPLKNCLCLTHVYLNDNKLTDISALSGSMCIMEELNADVEFVEPAPTAVLESGQLKSGTMKSGTIAVSADAAYISLSAANYLSEVYYSINSGKYQIYYEPEPIKLTKNSTIKAYSVANSTTIKSPTVTFNYKLTPLVDFNVTQTSGGKLVKLLTDATKVRTCSHRADVRIFEHNFVENKEKIRRRTVCTSRIFDAVLGKICRKDVRSTYENKFLSFTIRPTAALPLPDQSSTIPAG